MSAAGGGSVAGADHVPEAAGGRKPALGRWVAGPVIDRSRPAVPQTGAAATRVRSSMNRLLALLLLSSACTAAASAPQPRDEVRPTPAAPPAPAMATLTAAAGFDPALLCRSISDAEASLQARGLTVGEFGDTETDPPRPSRVGDIEYRFGGERRLAVVELSARLSALGPVTLGRSTVRVDATLESIAAGGIAGCGALEILEGGNRVVCEAGDATLTFSRGGPLADAPIEVSLSRSCG